MYARYHFARKIIVGGRAFFSYGIAMNAPFFLPTWPPEVSNFIWLGLLLLASELLGEAINRWFRQPRILGWVTVGIILGPSVTGALSPEALHSLDDVLNVAIGIVLFELGQRVDIFWLRRNPWLLGTSIVESFLSFSLVFFVLQLVGASALLSAVAAAIGVSTSPAVVLSLSRDLRAQGQVTERMLILTALNCIFAFLGTSVLLGWIASEHSRDWVTILGHPMYLVLGSILLSAALTSATLALLRIIGPRDEPQFICVIGMVIVAVWASEVFNLSVALTLLGFGTMMRTFDGRRQFVSLRFGRVGRFFLVLLFAITAARMDLGVVGTGIVAGLVFVVTRFVGKAAALIALARQSGLTRKKAWYLSLGMIPASGIAVVMVQQTASIYPEFGRDLAGVVMAAILILQFVGPILAHMALRASQESMQEGAR